MNRFVYSLFLFLFITTTIIPQEVFICDSYTEDGDPVGATNRFEIKPYGTAKYILLNNNEDINDPAIYLFLDKIVNGQITPFDSKTISIDDKKKWAVTSYEFSDPGIYEIYFLDFNHNRIVSTKIDVFYSDEFETKTISPNSNYLGECDFTFCELVIDGKPTNLFNSLSLSRSNGMAFIYLNNHVSFGIEVIKVQYWKKSKTNFNYEDLVDEKKYKLLPDWKDTFFKYYFKNTGDYKIDVFDINNNFISSNIITVTN